MIKITFKETFGINRNREPVTFGIPLPKSKINDISKLYFLDDDGQNLAHGANIACNWDDGSIKWVIVDLQISVAAKSCTIIRLKVKDNSINQNESLITLIEEKNNILIDTGSTRFTFDKNFFTPFIDIRHQGRNFLSNKSSKITLIDHNHNHCCPRVESWSVEHDSFLKKVLLFKGVFKNNKDKCGIKFQSRIHFYAGKSYSRIDFTIHNPQAAQHPGGVWDLGDKSSQYFIELSLCFAIKNFTNAQPYYIKNFSCQSESQINISPDTKVLLYQASSGSENWKSTNHMNKDGKIPLSFKGYKIYENGRPSDSGLKACPLMGISGSSWALSIFVPQFWQNFPKAVEVSKNNLSVKLFPAWSEDIYELQAGEQKTHVFYVGIENKFARTLKWAVDPLIPTISTPSYCQGHITPKPVPENEKDEEMLKYQRFVDFAIEGESAFLNKREIIDEYGWRNFGEIYADHEAVFSEKETEFVSHYNNQYDVIKGALIQYMRTGKKEWFTLARELGDHVSDIDIYHTDDDKYQYNHGMFWHTDHLLEASTSTHRTYSKFHSTLKPNSFIGGGPAPDHNYSTGLLYLYWMTGEHKYKDAVLELASNIVRLINGPETCCELIVETLKKIIKKVRDNYKKQAGNQENIYRFDGPGRASGNSLNTLIDAWLLTSNHAFLRQAEKLIPMCVSLHDDFEQMDLLNTELRWMYTIFLQALGRYLDVKKNANQVDEHFEFAKSVLIRYAKWMEKYECPYLDKPDILEFPNETWVAQDIRKSDIFSIAVKYAPATLQDNFIKKACFFFKNSMDQLSGFENHTLTRPLTILMTNGMSYMEMKSEKFSKETSTKPGNNQNFSMLLISYPTLKLFWRNLTHFSIKMEIKWIYFQLKVRY